MAKTSEYPLNTSQDSTDMIRVVKASGSTRTRRETRATLLTSSLPGTFTTLKVTGPWTDISHPTYGADPTGVADSAAAITAAIAATPVGGTLLIPNGKFKISTAVSFNRQINIRGMGPGSILWIEGLAGSDAITFGPTSGYMEGVHWSDFAILGGATAAANGLVIRNVNRSRFENIHVMLGSTVSSVWLKTSGILNHYNFIVSSNMIASYAYTPTIQAGKAVYASAASDAAGIFNANVFDLIIEGGPGYGLHVKASTNNGNNVYQGAYEGIQGEFSILIEGGEGARVTNAHLEAATAASTNILKFLDHSYGYIGPGVVSLPYSTAGSAGYNDVQLVNADNLIIDGLRTNRLSIDAGSDSVRIEEMWIVGLNDALLYDSGTNTRYYKAGSNATIATATPTTIFTPSGTAAIWEVFAFINDAGAEYLGHAKVMWDGTNARIVSDNGSLLTLTLSGSNVQVTQTSGGDANVFWRYFKGASR